MLLHLLDTLNVLSARLVLMLIHPLRLNASNVALDTLARQVVLRLAAVAQKVNIRLRLAVLLAPFALVERY